MSGKHGNIEGWKTIYTDESQGYAKAQIGIATDGTKVVHIKKPISEKEKIWIFTLYQPSYEGIKAIIKGLVIAESHNLNITIKEAVKKVEKELNIIIK